MNRVAIPLLLAAALSLAACGRKAPPHSPENSFYPQKYPDIALPDQSPPLTEAQRALEYQQVQALTKAPPPPAAPPVAPPPTTFDDLHHPAADATPGIPAP